MSIGNPARQTSLPSGNRFASPPVYPPAADADRAAPCYISVPPPHHRLSPFEQLTSHDSRLTTWFGAWRVLAQGGPDRAAGRLQPRPRRSRLNPGAGGDDRGLGLAICRLQQLAGRSLIETGRRRDDADRALAELGVRGPQID